MAEERLQRALARAGFGSRRTCEELIARGGVRVNGKVATLGDKVDPERDRIQAEFAPVDSELPELDRVVPEDSATLTHTVQIRDLGGHFLPTAGGHPRVPS